jgi:hypothetical protein
LYNQLSRSETVSPHRPFAPLNSRYGRSGLVFFVDPDLVDYQDVAPDTLVLEVASSLPTDSESQDDTLLLTAAGTILRERMVFATGSKVKLARYTGPILGLMFRLPLRQWRSLWAQMKVASSCTVQPDGELEGWLVQQLKDEPGLLSKIVQALSDAVPEQPELKRLSDIVSSESESS